MNQQLKTSSLNSIGKILYLTEEFRDLTVTVQTETSHFKFPAHKLILASESTVLRSKLDDENVKEVLLEDVTPSTAELLLRYIYQGELELEDWNTATDLLTAAYKYEIKDLIQKCGRFLEKVISLSNVCQIYNQATICSLPVLQDKCLKLILDAGFVVLKTGAFELLNKDCVMDVVASPELNIDSELSVFQTLFKWARIECCRSELQITDGNILAQIKPFLQHVCIDDMSDADKSALPPMILSCVKPNNRNRINFSVLESLIKYSHRLEFDTNQNCLDFIGNNLSCVRFSTDSAIHLIGIGFTFVGNSISTSLAMTLVKENSPRVTLFSQNLCPPPVIRSTQINQRFWYNCEVLLKQPVLLKPKDIYNLFAVDCETDNQCPRIFLSSGQIRTHSGYKNFALHGEDTWGVTALILI